MTTFGYFVNNVHKKPKSLVFDAGNGAKDVTEEFQCLDYGICHYFCVFLCNISIRFLLKSGYKDENYKAKPMPLMAEGPNRKF